MSQFQVVDETLALNFSCPLGPVEANEECNWQENEFEKWLSLDGRRHGICYLKTSTLKAEAFYWQGELHGPSIYYHAKGEKLSQTYFVHGQRWGLAQFWYPSGVLAKQLHYQEDKLEGEQRYYSANSQLKTVVTYKNGKACGLLRHYHSEDRLAREAMFENGLKEGHERTWYLNGQPQSERFFAKGMPQGYSLTWYESGQIAEEMEYLNPSWKFNYKRFRENGELIAEGVSHDDGSFEEKKYASSGNTLIQRRVCLRNEQGKVISERLFG